MRGRTAIIVLGMLVFGVGAGAGARQSLAQSALVRGLVEDENGDPIPGAHVYLNQTMTGTTTDGDGRYLLSGLLPGSYELVAGFIGYHPSVRSFEVEADAKEYEFNFRLTTRVIEMDEVDISAERTRGWDTDFRRFEELFIGTGPNADRTSILNPFVLDFETEGDLFTARASEALQIENRALGYRISFELTDFWFDKTTRQINQQGAMHFAELEEGRATAWAENRAKTYRGSLAFLLSSVVRGNIIAERITLKLDDRENAPYSDSAPWLESVTPMELVEPTELPYLFILRFSDFLFVEIDWAQSWIQLNKEFALVHSSGYVYAPRDAAGTLTVHGAMAGRGLSDLLPWEYGLGQ